ncbi:hypothetical protein MmazTMA_11850 [Methanosarcina mazei]|nr:hypothetical protein MmazTMA_11850 [Methanosarcina mazei]
MPRSAIKTGNSVNGLAWPRTCSNGLTDVSNSLNHPPRRNPSGNATRRANPKPINTLLKLDNVCVINSPDSVRSTIEEKITDGGDINNIFTNPILGAISHISRNMMIAIDR